jgi:predicted small lipoprotein YifL
MDERFLKVARSAMLRPIRRSGVIQSPRFAPRFTSSLAPRLTLARCATLGALVAALGLAGCGRKAGLDDPPMAAAGDVRSNAQPDAAPTLGPDGKPIPPPDKRKTFLDWLID